MVTSHPSGGAFSPLKKFFHSQPENLRPLDDFSFLSAGLFSPISVVFLNFALYFYFLF